MWCRYHQRPVLTLTFWKTITTWYHLDVVKAALWHDAAEAADHDAADLCPVDGDVQEHLSGPEEGWDVDRAVVEFSKIRGIDCRRFFFWFFWVSFCKTVKLLKWSFVYVCVMIQENERFGQEKNGEIAKNGTWPVCANWISLFITRAREECMVVMKNPWLDRKY